MRWFITMTMAIVIAASSTGGVVSAKPDGGKLHRQHAAHVMAAPSHQAMYMQLLAEKYAPETAAAWKQTMAERVQLMNELQQLKKSGKWNREEMKAKMEGMAKEKGEAMRAHMALVDEFTKAIESENAKEIKAVLPKLLDSEQKMNKALKEWIESAKQTKK